MLDFRCPVVWFAVVLLVLASPVFIRNATAQTCVNLYGSCTDRPCCQDVGPTLCWRYNDGRRFCFLRASILSVLGTDTTTTPTTTTTTPTTTPTTTTTTTTTTTPMTTSTVPAPTTTTAPCQFAPCLSDCNCCPSSPNCVPSPLPGATDSLCFP